MGALWCVVVQQILGGNGIRAVVSGGRGIGGGLLHSQTFVSVSQSVGHRSGIIFVFLRHSRSGLTVLLNYCLNWTINGMYRAVTGDDDDGMNCGEAGCHSVQLPDTTTECLSRPCAYHSMQSLRGYVVAYQKSNSHFLFHG